MQRIESAARLIQQARRAERIADLPANLAPADEAEAYAIQDALLPDEEIAGWKVAPASATKVHRCSPMSSQVVLADGGAISGSAVAPEIEGEVGLIIGRTLSAGAGCADVLNAISGACLAIEVLDSCFVDRKRADPLSALADCQSNAGLVVGSIRPEWRTLDFGDVRPRFVTSAGEDIAPAKPVAATDAVLDAVLWLARHAAERGRPLRRGQVVITGARVGPVPIPRGRAVRVEAEGFQGAAIRRD